MQKLLFLDGHLEFLQIERESEFLPVNDDAPITLKGGNVIAVKLSFSAGSVPFVPLLIVGLFRCP